jgi:glycosyltransferase involved in cell wall biosynthesis
VFERKDSNWTRILVLPSPHHPGGGNFYQEHSEALAEQGYEVDVLINRVIEATRIRISDVGSQNRLIITNRNGVRTIESAYRRVPYQALKNIRDWTKSTVALYERYRKKFGDPSVMLVFSAVWTGFAASEISRLYGIPYLLTEHRSRFTGLRQEALDMIKEPHLPFLEAAFSGASRIITVSDSLAPIITRYSGDTKILTIPNLVDTDFFRPPETPEKDAFKVLAAGRLESEKGIDLLIQAFDLLANDDPAAELHIVGEGPIEQDLRTMASKTFDPERIHFLGTLTRDELLEEMQNASVLALTSRFEAFGLVLAEAMSTGLPVLATRCGGPESIVPKYAGLLVDCESAPAVYVGLKNMQTGYFRYDPDKIRQYAIKRFGKSTVIGRYKYTIDRVLQEIPQEIPDPVPTGKKENRTGDRPKKSKAEISRASSTPGPSDSFFSPN